MAIAPPRALTISGSIPQASMQASDCTANASFSSTAPTSDQPMPARRSACSAASTGAYPNSCGSSAYAPRPAIRATGARPDPVRGRLGAEQHRGGAVVERRGVAGGDGAVGTERPA